MNIHLNVPEAASTAVVPRLPYPNPSLSLRVGKAYRAVLNVIADADSRHSIAAAKLENRHLIGACPSHLDPQTVKEARSRRLYQVLPSLSGPHSVGHTSFIIDGPKTRSVRTGEIGDDKIGIELYAPTRKSTGNKAPLEFPERHLETILSPEQMHTLHTHSLDQIDPGKRKMPVLIFSHGLGVNPTDYRHLLENLASRGCLVVSLNHPSSSGHAPFSQEAFDSEALNQLDRSDPEKCSKEIERLASKQAENIRFVVEQIRSGSLDGISKELALSDRIVLAGHSLGGSASVIVSKTDPDIAGCIDVDGALQKDDHSTGLKMPLLMIFADHLRDQDKGSKEEREEFQNWKTKGYDPMFQDWKTLHENSTNSRVGQIKGISHMDFCITPVLNWLVGLNTANSALKAQQIASWEISRFMNL